VHTTPEQCLMSITTIARQAQRMHAGEVIAKLGGRLIHESQQ
jgi:hypothetical protein